MSASRRWWFLVPASSRDTAYRLPVMALGLALMASAGLAARHLDHYADRAHANERTLLAEFMAQPICSGSSVIPVTRSKQGGNDD
jgi:hypothetical protein